MERLFRIRASQCGKIMGKLNNKGELPATCTTYLKEWYANDQEEVYSKYMEKGIAVEDDLIDFAAAQLGYGMASKNKVRLSDEYFDGECDIEFHDAICDVKAAWNRKTLHDRAIEGLCDEHEYQLRVYMHLYKKPKGILFTGLMDTPETDWRPAVIYEDMPDNERWCAFTITHDPSIILAIQERVILCRKWLTEYDHKIKSILGTIKLAQ